MTLGFQIKEEDVITVLDSHCVKYSKLLPEDDSGNTMPRSLLSMINQQEVENEVFSMDIDQFDSNDDIIKKQAEAVYDAIAWQLLKKGIPTKEEIIQYGNPVLAYRPQ